MVRNEWLDELKYPRLEAMGDNDWSYDIGPDEAFGFVERIGDEYVANVGAYQEAAFPSLRKAERWLATRYSMQALEDKFFLIYRCGLGLKEVGEMSRELRRTVVDHIVNAMERFKRFGLENSFGILDTSPDPDTARRLVELVGGADARQGA